MIRPTSTCGYFIDYFIDLTTGRRAISNAATRTFIEALTAYLHSSTNYTIAGEQKMHRFLAKLILLLVTESILAKCCMEHERQALLEFKGSVNDPSNRLGSWRGDQCCNWAGIRCSNRTGHVVSLNLHNPYSYSILDEFDNDYDRLMKHSLSGKVSSSLLALSKLKHLDLSYNNFTRIPEFIGSFQKLKYLNLSRACFSGNIPPQLGNLTQLQFLDLTDNDFSSANIWWISRLTSLRHLDMSRVYLPNSTEWVQPLNKLPLLVVLIFDANSLTHIPQSVPLLNFTSLRILQLSEQHFNTTIPSWIFSIHSLTDLNLEGSHFVGRLPNALGNLTSLSKLVVDFNPLYGKIPPLYNLTKLTYLSLASTSLGEGNITQISSSFTHETWLGLEGLILWGNNLTGNLNGWVGEMTNLKYLDLGNNNLSGPVSDDIGNLKNLAELDLSGNNLSGPVPDDIGNLKNLVLLDLSRNSLIGLLTEVHLGRLSKLETLLLDTNPITIAVETNWQPSFQLGFLRLDSCLLLKFPAWLQNQVEIEVLNLENSGIDDVLPDWLWSLASLGELVLSDNKIRGQLPTSLENMKNLQSLYLNDNHLEGKIPSSYPEFLSHLYLFNNRFEQLPRLFEAPNLQGISLANNSISGTIELTFCRATKLSFLDLSSNNLSGNLPNCSLNNLEMLNLANNKLSGTVPSTLLYSGPRLQVLQLSNNVLTGEFPSFLRFCEGLIFLDIGYNKFHGEIPKWIGENLAFLQILRLRSNLFSGSIPSEITMLNLLQFLDLSNNNFSGHIPMHLDNLTNMIDSFPRITMDIADENILATIKGVDRIYDISLFGSVRIIDLSNNDLTGVIPDKIVALAGLINLNLSNNHLIGKIPMEIGKMKSLESLDFHRNDLSGSIPESMSALNFLGVLNLSYNNLSGPIPRGNQLQTFDNSSYMENPYLCGPPLKTSCDSSSSPGSTSNEGHSRDREKLWFYLFVEFGFVAGFLGLFLLLQFKRSWRYAYFHLVDNLFDRIYVLGALTLKRLREQT